MQRAEPLPGWSLCSNPQPIAVEPAADDVHPALLLRQRRATALQAGMLSGGGSGARSPAMTLRFLSTARIGAILAGGAAMTLTPASARAADPTTADCLAATEAALKSGDEHRLRGERSQLLICAAA